MEDMIIMGFLGKLIGLKQNNIIQVNNEFFICITGGTYYEK